MIVSDLRYINAEFCSPCGHQALQGVSGQDPHDQLDDCEQCGEDDCGYLESHFSLSNSTVKSDANQYF